MLQPLEQKIIKLAIFGKIKKVHATHRWSRDGGWLPPGQDQHPPIKEKAPPLEMT